MKIYKLQQHKTSKSGKSVTEKRYSSKFLIFEGVDAKQVATNLCRRYDSIPAFRIKSTSGFPILAKSNRIEMNVEGSAALGLLTDANEDPHARWQVIVHSMRGSEYEVPGNIPARGIILDGSPRIEVWIIPDHIGCGELEDFAQRMIFARNFVWPRAKRYIDFSPEAKRRFKF